MTLSSAEITSYIGLYFWPFMRISAMLMVAPVFGAQQIVPVRTRLGLAVALTWLVSGALPAAPVVDPMGAVGIMVALQQLLLGVAMGLILQLAFSTLVLAGQSVGMAMGLGFASFVDPVNGVSVPVVSRFYSIVGTLLFLAINGHLVAIRVLVSSFRTMPVAPLDISGASMLALALWGGQMFAGALLIALPAMMTIVLINVAFGVMTRAAPQLNIFAVGFPTMMAAGFVVMLLTLPSLLPRFSEILMNAFELMRHIAVAGA